MQLVISYTLRDLLRRELTRIRHTPLGALAVLVELTTLTADRKKERLMATIETLLTVWKILHLPETTINVAYKLRKHWVTDRMKERRMAVLASPVKVWVISKQP